MKSILGLFTVLLGTGGATMTYANSENFVVIDVRTKDEYNESHVKDSEHIDILESSFIANVQKLDKNKVYKVYCRSGNRSGQAEKIMKTLGFKDVENLGSLQQAATKLGRKCEGKNPC